VYHLKSNPVTEKPDPATQRRNTSLAMLGGLGLGLIMVALVVGAMVAGAVDAALLTSMVLLGLALLVIATIAWFSLVRPDKPFDDINIPQFTGHESHGPSASH
jgi:thiol:disulfide interchange protein